MSKINKIGPIYVAAFLFVLFGVFAFLTYNYTGAYGDLAEYLNNPLRVLNGELPYRDFWLLFPPGEVMLPAFLYRIFGLNVNVLLSALALIHGFIGMLAFLAGKKLFDDNLKAVLLAVLMFFLGVNHVYILPLLLALMFFADRRNFWVGVFVGLAFYFRFFVGGAAAAAFFLSILLRDRLKGALLYSLGGFLAVLLVYAPLYGIWPDIWQAVVWDSLQHGTSMNLPYFVEAGARLHDFKVSLGNGNVFDILYQFGRAGVTVLLYLLPFLVGTMSVFYLSGKGSNKLRGMVFFFFMWMFFAFFKALGRSDISHLVHALTPALFLLVFFLGVKGFRLLSSALIALLLIQVLLNLWSQIKLLTEPSYEVSTEYGSLKLDDKEEAEALKNVLDTILAETDEGDYIFVDFWDASPIYALTNRMNPTYYDSLIDFVARPLDEKQEKLCADLLEFKPKFVVHNAQWMFDGKEEFKFENAAPILVECVEENFELVGEWDDYSLYKVVEN
ncbi:hypothetical protein HY605_02900 [Candidatus Peregrinibacteria bacterium]|nr:hypothetical protein [Candidatus Peregrinibacteria bacterium]